MSADYKNGVNLPIMRLISKKPVPMLAATFGVYIGMGLLWLGEQHLPLAFFFEQYGWKSLGLLFITFSTFYLMLIMSREQREKRFIDIDDQKATIQDSLVIDKLIGEIDELKQSQASVDYQFIEELIRKSNVVSSKPETGILGSFETYFNALRTTLEEKAGIADQKASILLDKGTSYSRGGITFFVISIMVWQALSWIKGFQTQFIYGIASCSVLFIFIEFLSAWFLKQYRQFVDTSTY